MISVRLAAVMAFVLTTAPALADASLVDMGAATACRLDRVREIIAGAQADSTDPELVDQLIVENTVDWLPDYNAFASSPEAAELAAAAAAVNSKKPSRAQCRQLLPFAAVSASAARISAAGGNVSAGSVLATCESGTGLCLPASTARIADQCGVPLFKLPLRSTC